MSKKVLMAVANYYTSPFQVGSHHYARAFEKLGYEVLFISAPISPIHKMFANSDELEERIRINKTGGEIRGNIKYYVPNALFTPQNKPFLSSSFILNYWYKFSYPNLYKYLEQNNFLDVDILWFDGPTYGFLLNIINFKKSILRISDYEKGFSTTSNNQFLKEIEIANKVNHIVYSAKNLKNKYIEIKDKEKMIYLPNGIDLNFFENSDKSFPKEFNNIPEPRVIYIGAIQEWFDVELVYYVASHLKEYSFIIIGPEKKDLSMLKSLKNVFLLGAKSYDMVPSLLYNSDIGIIPFDVKRYPELINSVNPLKMYEYLACGLQVVSIRWEQIDDMEDYISLAETKEEFLNSIQTKIDKKIFPLDDMTWIGKLKKLLESIE